MTELNNCEPKKVKVLGKYTFSIGDTSEYGEYIRGGIATQIKMPKSISFKPLKEAQKNPEFVITDFGKFDHPPTLHVAFDAFSIYVEKYGEPPKPWNDADAKEFMNIVNEIKGDAEIKDDLIEIFAKVRYKIIIKINNFIYSTHI